MHVGVVKKYKTKERPFEDEEEVLQRCGLTSN